MLGAIRQQAITWANVDPDFCHHMVSLGQDELTDYLGKQQGKHDKNTFPIFDV